jgi:O-antigen/teichoic acid export membrane protein
MPARPPESAQSLRTPAVGSARPRGLAASAGLLALGSLFTQAAQIIALSVLARLVAKPELATYQQLNLIYNVAAPLLLVGVPTALLYFIPRASTAEERRAWVFRAYVLLGTTGLLAASAAVLLRHPLAQAFNNPGLSAAVVLYAPYLMSVFIAAATPPALVACGAAGRAAVLNAMLGALTLVALVTAALIEPTGTSLAVGLSASGVALAVASVFTLSRTLGLSATDDDLRRGLRSMLRYGLPLTVVSVAGTIAYQFDRVVVGTSFSPQDFAIYALGAVEIPIVLLVGQAVTNVLIPALAKLWQANDRIGMIALWHLSIRKMGVILLPSFVFLMLMAEEVVRLLYGPGYDESVVVFRIYLFLIPLRVANWSIIPTAMGWTRLYAPGAILVVVNVAIALATVGPIGLAGPALAAPVATAVTALYYVWRLRPVLETSITRLVPFRPLAKILLTALLAAVPLVYIKYVPMVSSVRLVLAACVYSAIVVAALRLTRQIPDEDWVRLVRLVARVWRRERHDAPMP